jgi:hypothetical protein
MIQEFIFAWKEALIGFAISVIPGLIIYVDGAVRWKDWLWIFHTKNK